MSLLIGRNSGSPYIRVCVGSAATKIINAIVKYDSAIGSIIKNITNPLHTRQIGSNQKICYTLSDYKSNKLMSVLFLSKKPYDLLGEQEKAYKVDYIYTFPAFRRQRMASHLLRCVRNEHTMTAFTVDTNHANLFITAGFHENNNFPGSGILDVHKYMMIPDIAKNPNCIFDIPKAHNERCFRSNDADNSEDIQACKNNVLHLLNQLLKVHPNPDIEKLVDNYDYPYIGVKAKGLLIPIYINTQVAEIISNLPSRAAIA
jgi:hypothetical protein